MNIECRVFRPPGNINSGTHAKPARKYADLVVLDYNPFEVDPLQIGKIDVLMTMMDGKFTYQGNGEEPDASSRDIYLSPAEYSPEGAY